MPDLSFATTTVVIFEIPGHFGPDFVTLSVKSRRPEREINNAPKGAVSFHYEEVVEAVVRIGQERVVLRSEGRNTSGKHYISATHVQDLSRIDSYARRGVEKAGAKTAVRLVDGTFRPFFIDRDRIHPPKATAVRGPRVPAM